MFMKFAVYVANFPFQPRIGDRPPTPFTHSRLVVFWPAPGGGGSLESKSSVRDVWFSHIRYGKFEFCES